MNIEQCFIEYKNLSEKIISNINTDKEISDLLDDREKIIKNIFTSGMRKNYIKEVYIDMGLEKIDFELGLLIKSEMEKTMLEIKDIKKRRNVQSVYSSFNRNQNIFSKKI